MPSNSGLPSFWPFASRWASPSPGYISYTLEFRGAHEEVIEKSRVLLEMGSSMRAYTSEEIAPIVRALGFEGAFHPQMVPSYGAQSTLAKLHKQFPEYVYRENSLNPTNVADRASDWEVGLIRAFQRDADLKEWSGETGEGDALRYFLARPLRMKTPDCLQCHSTPDAAPKAMVARRNGGASSALSISIGRTEMAAGNEKTSRVPADAKVAPRPAAAESPGGPSLEAEGKRRQSGAQKAAGNGDDAIEDASLAGREDADKGGS